MPLMSSRGGVRQVIRMVLRDADSSKCQNFDVVVDVERR